MLHYLQFKKYFLQHNFFLVILNVIEWNVTLLESRMYRYVKFDEHDEKQLLFMLGLQEL